MFNKDFKNIGKVSSKVAAENLVKEYTPVEGEPRIKGGGRAGLNEHWIRWYRMHHKVTTNIAMAVGKKILRRMYDKEQA
jgi:hypothetical protein